MELHTKAFTAFVLAILPAAALAQAPSCFTAAAPDPLPASLRNTVVITPESNVFSAADFSLGTTLGNIIKTSTSTPPTVVDSPAERIALLTGLVRSFRTTEHLNPESGLRLRHSARLGEATLDPIKLLDATNANGMRPVALFNRWDLAPNDFKYCGEHRIVYAKGNPVSDTNRFFLIFEAGLDNPDPQNRKEGCRPVIEFWESLKTKSGPVLATALHDFYYKGLDTNGDGVPDFQPVIHHQHYGVPFGQVRGNLFVNNPSFIWQLREWRTSVTADGAPAFTVDTVKKNPHPALYGPSQTGEEQGLDGLRQTFVEELLRTYTSEITSFEQRGIGSGNTLIAGFGANFSGKFDHFQSDAASSDDPAGRANGTNLGNRIAARLTDLRLPESCKPTAAQILNRAGALSCGGCHQFSNGKEIAPGVAWPASAGFVHVNEQGQLSAALRDHFLAARRANMQKDLDQPAVTATAAPRALVTVRDTREALGRVQNADTRAQAIDALRDLENRVQMLRAQDAHTPGGSIQFRRTH